MKNLIFATAATFSIYFGFGLEAMAQSRSSIKVETFNLGLAHGFVDHAAERTPKLLEAIQESDADILCLQEVWSLTDREIVHEALSKKFSDIYLTPVYQTTTASRPSCMPWQLFGKGKFVSCMQSQCKDQSGDDFTDCIIEECGESLERLKSENRQCASALMAKVGKNPLISMLQLMNPFYRSGLYAYRGSNGLMLASKLPLKNKKLADFSDISTLNRRQALKADIELNGETVQVMCAHLSADLDVPYTGLSRNWGDENYTQALRILEETALTESAIVMGDFNCGLESEVLSPELPDSCLLLERGFQDPLKDLDKCTYCSNNLLNKDTEKDKYIDHIFLKGLSASEGKIKYDRPVEIQVGKESKTVNLSDHYGAQLTIDLTVD